MNFDRYCMRMRKIILLFTAFFLFKHTNAQNYPKDYFRNPLDIPIFLAGNFGECRPNHFHSGIDIKTLGKENQPVHAAADGYVSRIKMEPGGFGHGVYITHPNGYTTLYAHLNDLAPELQQYVRAEQYKKESWEVDLQLSPSQFPVKKGQQIAWSGNTGASTAPHLHFEIRDTKTEHPLNPLLFGLKVEDDIAPVPTQVAVYNLSKSIYEQTPQKAALKKKGGAYVADTISINSPVAGVGVNVNDFMDGSDNSLTYYTAELHMDGIPQGTITLDDIGYDETRYMHAFVDYKTKKQTGAWMQNMFQLPNNRLNHIYTWPDNKHGKLDISDGKAHHIELIITDALANKTNILFYIKYQGIDSASSCSNLFKCNAPNKFEHPNVSLSLNDRALYDDVCFHFAEKQDAASYSDRYQIHYSYVPVHTYFDLRIKPNKAIPFNLKDKIALVYTDGNDEDGRAATLDNGFYKASVRNFGEYRLAADNEAPVIRSAYRNGVNLAKAKRIGFIVKDAITSVKRFRGELDGKWICFEQHGDNFFYTFDEHCSKGKHQLVFTAIDENNNKRTVNFTFTR